MERPGSPAEGFSSLTTSAPSQAIASVQEGPASNCVRSNTRTPARQSSPALACIGRHSSGSGLLAEWRQAYDQGDEASRVGRQDADCGEWAPLIVGRGGFDRFSAG